MLDLACGSGRNSRWLAEQGFQVLAVDHDAEALGSLSGLRGVTPYPADLESGSWPLAGKSFDAIVVCRYLHRPLLPRLAEALNDGGLLIYETFMTGQETLGRPRNPAFLLAPDELRLTYQGLLEIIDFEQGLFSEPHPAYLQRLCARR